MPRARRCAFALAAATALAWSALAPLSWVLERAGDEQDQAAGAVQVRLVLALSPKAPADKPAKAAERSQKPQSKQQPPARVITHCLDGDLAAGPASAVAPTNASHDDAATTSVSLLCAAPDELAASGLDPPAVRHSPLEVSPPQSVLFLCAVSPRGPPVLAS